jgi:hypothetical protein
MVFDSLSGGLNGVATARGWYDIEVREKMYAVAWKIINR